MPLIKSKSKKAFDKNMETEMDAGKPQKQSLAIAYSVKKNAPKKMAGGGSASYPTSRPDNGFGRVIMKAEGGEVNIPNQKRPMPEDKFNDSKSVSENSGMKPAKEDSWSSQPERKQSMQGMKTTPIKYPKMVPSKGFTAKLRDQEDDLMRSAPPESDKMQPPKENEMQTSENPDMQKEHSSGRKPYAKGGVINEEESMHAAEQDGEMEAPGEESDDDQESPPEKEFESGEWTGNKFAEGGMAHEEDDQPMDEEELEHHASIAAAIMAKMRKMAKGGAINGMESTDSDDSDQADMERRSQEDTNMEDQQSYNALRKENYSEKSALDQMDQPEDSNEHGHMLSDEDEHDMISSIRKKMKIKNAFTK